MPRRIMSSGRPVYGNVEEHLPVMSNHRTSSVGHASAREHR